MEEFNNELSSLLNSNEDSDSEEADTTQDSNETFEDKEEVSVDAPLQQPEKTNDATTHDEKPAPTDFPILKEVSVDDEDIPKPSTQKQSPQHRSAPIKKIVTVAVALVALLGTAWFGYPAIQKFWIRPPSTILLEAQTTQPAPPETTPSSDVAVSTSRTTDPPATE